MNELIALRLARAQLVTRTVQLAACRVCGAQRKEFEEAVAIIDTMIKEREDAVQPRP